MRQFVSLFSLRLMVRHISARQLPHHATVTYLTVTRTLCHTMQLQIYRS